MRNAFPVSEILFIILYPVNFSKATCKMRERKKKKKLIGNIFEDIWPSRHLSACITMSRQYPFWGHNKYFLYELYHVSQ